MDLLLDSMNDSPDDSSINESVKDVLNDSALQETQEGPSCQVMRGVTAGTTVGGTAIARPFVQTQSHRYKEQGKRDDPQCFTWAAWPNPLPPNLLLDPRFPLKHSRPLA